MSKKRYQNGGVVGNTNYPFGQGQNSKAPQSPEMTQTPTVEVKTAGAESADLSRPFGLKKGGKVRSASSRGDGIAKRGKTRA